MSKVAYGVYTYAIGVTPVGKLGVAEYKNSAVTLPVSPTALDRQDPKVFYFKDLEGKSCIFMAGTKYNSSYQPEAGQFAVYDENLNLLVQPYTTSALVNLYTVTGPVDLGDQYQYLFGIDYDLHKVVRFRVSAGSGLSIDRVYDAFVPDAGKGYGLDVVTDGKAVYALFVSAVNPFTGDYAGYSIVKLDLDLKNPVRLDADGEKNPFSLDLYNGDLYVTVVGGMQNYGSTNGASSKIQKVSTKDFSVTSEIKTLLVGGATADLGDFRALSFTSSGDAYILTGRLNSDAATFDGALYHTTADALANASEAVITDIADAKYAPDGKVDSFNQTNGYLWGLFYSEADNVVWTAQGNDLGVYKYGRKKLSQVAFKAISDLAGSAYSLNSVSLLEAGGQMKGYVAPAFASVSKAARLERKKLLKK